MQKFAFQLVLFVLVCPYSHARDRVGDCAEAISSLQEAQKYCERAYCSDLVDDLHYNAEGVIQLAQDAERYANKCGCTFAESAAVDLYKQVHKAYLERRLEDAKIYIRHAKKYCTDGLHTADSCNQ